MNGNDLWYEEPDDQFDDDQFDDGQFDDGEFDDGEFDDDDSTETVPCSECGAEVYEDAVQCPHCGSYIVARTNVWAGRPGWWIALGILGVAAVILALAGYAAR
ncbi:MAG: zinc-ribbon domain-containing protein [Thermoguttaceae bacterium]